MKHMYELSEESRNKESAMLHARVVYVARVCVNYDDQVLTRTGVPGFRSF